MAQKNIHLHLSPLKITVIYLVVAGLWIVFSDNILESLVTDQQTLSTFQTYKGLFYVLITSLGLYYLIKEHHEQIVQKEKKIDNVSLELSSEQELKTYLFDRIPVMITVYDPALNEFDVNREFEKVTGYTNEYISDNNLLGSLYPDLDTREEAVAFMNSPGVGWKEFPVTTKEGTQIPTSWTNVKLTDDTSVGIGIDMSEIKASHAELRESKALLEKTFESLEESVILVDPETRKIVDCNKGTEKIFGYAKDELIGESTQKLHIDKENFKKFDEIGKENLQEDGVFKTGFEMQKKDGTRFYSSHTVTLVYDKDGNVEKIVSAIRDITAQKKYQKELEERNQFIEKTLEHIPIGVAVNRIDSGKVTLMNQEFTQIYGWPRETLKNVESFFKKVYPDEEYRKRIFDMVTADIASEKPERMQWRGIRVTTKKGKEKIVNAKNIPLYDQNLMISTVIDVTEQKKLEVQLRQSEKKYRHLFENNPEPMWIYDPETLEFVEVNQAAISHYGYSEDEFMDMTLADIRPREDLEALNKDVEDDLGKDSYSEEWRHLKKDGTLINVEVSAANVQYQGNTYRLVLANDITERKHIQEKIIQSVIEGEDRERKRIAHELHDGLGQYLVAANMNFESVKDEISQLREKREEQFKTGLSLLKNAISETRSISYNLMPKAIADFGLYTALENLIQDYRKSTDINFELHCNHKDLQLTEKAETNIYRILQESISNTVQHADCDNLSITLEKENDTLHIVITDDGKGTQLNQQHEEQGLGLRSIKTRVTNLNGKLNISSKPGKGMKISIEIPVP
ncbi:MAG: PAS domain S-box protein [Balneolaceae bacterium]|nr:PAS domain S-box protein [Balneolaceae bacterium]